MAGGNERDTASRDMVVNVFAWSMNVTTSVVIIFVIKALMSVYRFQYATTISGLHFVICAWTAWGLERAGLAQPADMPLRASLLFATVGALSIGTANLSLLLNSVGFYQIAKLLMSPFVAAVEVLWLGKRFPPPVIGCVLLVLAGVGVVTVSDVTVHPAGMVMAGLFVLTGGLQQILCGHLQQRLGLQGHQLMSNTGALQGMILLIVGPFVDKLATSKWILEWEANVPGIEMLALSCLLAVAVNASQYLVLGRFSATSFQVLGHAKTLLVLIGGWFLFDEPVNPRKLAGMSLAFIGMVGYGYFSSRAATAARAAAAIDPAAAAAAAAAAKTVDGRGPASPGVVGLGLGTVLPNPAARLGLGGRSEGDDAEAAQPLLSESREQDGVVKGDAVGRGVSHRLVADEEAARPGRLTGGGGGAAGASKVAVLLGFAPKHKHVQ